MSQESVATSPYVFPGLLKISGIPGVRHLTGGRGVVQETVDLPLGITAADAAPSVSEVVPVTILPSGKIIAPAGAPVSFAFFKEAATAGKTEASVCD